MSLSRIPRRFLPITFPRWPASYVTGPLGGDGGDENFAGYRRYNYDQMENTPAVVSAGSRAPWRLWTAGRRLSRAGPRRRDFCGPKPRFKAWRARRSKDISIRVSLFREDFKARLFAGDFARSLTGYDSLDVLQYHYDRADTPDLLSRIQYVDIKTYLPDDILAKVDRASMADSLEVRAPLLDHKLMELVAKIPSSLKLRGRNGKYIFKKAVESVLPKGVTTRKKQGFAVPLGEWFRGELRETAHEAIFSSKTDDGILDAQFVEKNLGTASTRRLRPLAATLGRSNVPKMEAGVCSLVARNERNLRNSSTRRRCFAGQHRSDARRPGHAGRVRPRSHRRKIRCARR